MLASFMMMRMGRFMVMRMRRFMMWVRRLMVMWMRGFMVRMRMLDFPFNCLFHSLFDFFYNR